MLSNPVPKYFRSGKDFRKWLEKNHAKKKELLVGYYKTRTGKPTMTWSESVDQALCFGWIDGIRRSIDDERYCIRFTPRKPNSVWSDTNIKKVEVLLEQGLMRTVGLVLFNARKPSLTNAKHQTPVPEKLSKEFEKKFRSNKKAWNYFNVCPPSYQKTAIAWVMGAKQEATKLKRFSQLLDSSSAGKR